MLRAHRAVRSFRVFRSIRPFLFSALPSAAVMPFHLHYPPFLVVLPSRPLPHPPPSRRPQRVSCCIRFLLMPSVVSVVQHRWLIN